MESGLNEPLPRMPDVLILEDQRESDKAPRDQILVGPCVPVPHLAGVTRAPP
jgi:hypothetical protein